MADPVLHIFAVNAQTEARHTFLSRSNGEASDLPDLAGWLSLRQGGLNTDEIELFPVSDLAGLSLTDYIRTAFDPKEAGLSTAAPRLNALDGHVLLIPDAALAGNWTEGPNLTQVASLPLPVADHSAAALTPAPQEVTPPQPEPTPPPPPRRSTFMPAVITAFFLAVILFTVSNFW